MSVDHQSEDFTLKVIELSPIVQLDNVIQRFLKHENLLDSHLELIRSTSDSEINFNYLRFFNNEDNLNKFLKFYKSNYDQKEDNATLQYEIIRSENELNLQLPGHLFVKGILPNVTAQDLYNIFKPFGEINTCKIIFNEFGISRGFGFINFANKSEANSAIKKLNGQVVNGSQLFINHHISKKDRLKDLEYKKNNFSNIYINNLPLNYSKSKLRTLFSPFGEIESIIVPQNKSASSSASSIIEQGDSVENKGAEDELSTRGYAFINFKYHEDAFNALEKMDGYEIEPGMKLQIGKAEHRKERFQYESLNSHFANTSMRYSSTSQLVMGEEVAERNHKRGESLTSIDSSPPPRVIPFTYNHRDNSQELILNEGDQREYYQHQHSHPHQQPHQPQPQPQHQLQHQQAAQPQMIPPFIIAPDSNIIFTSTGLPIAGPQYQDSNLYICHLPKDFKDEDLISLFERFGQIISAKVITWQEDEIDKQQQNEEKDEEVKVGEGKGFGFVCFASPLDASKALVNMNGYRLNSKHLLQVSFAQRKENKYQRGEMHHYIQNHLSGLYRYIGGMYSNQNAHLMGLPMGPPLMGPPITAPQPPQPPHMIYNYNYRGNRRTFNKVNSYPVPRYKS